MAELGPRSVTNMIFILVLAVLVAGGLFLTFEMVRDAMT